MQRLDLKTCWEGSFDMELALNRSIRKWVSLSAILGFAVFLLYLYFFSDIKGVVSVIGETNLPFYSLAFICVLGSVAFNALAWHRLLRTLELKVSYRRVFNLSWVGIFVDAIIPGGWSGDAFKAYLISRDPNVDGGKAASSIVAKNVLELFLTLSISVLGLVLLALNYTLEGGVLITVGITMLLLTAPLIIIIYFSMNTNATKKVLRAFKRLSAFIRRHPSNMIEFEARIEKPLKEYHNGLITLRKNTKALIQPAVFQTLAWSFDLFALFFIFASIGYNVPMDKIIITNTIAANLHTQGVALAGFAQLVSLNIYNILSIPPPISGASTVLAGFASFWFKTIIAFFAFQSVVLSRCLPPFCLHVNGLRDKSRRDEKLLAKSNSD
jgi:uncharacterized protein (TIRG00374 family)